MKRPILIPALLAMFTAAGPALAVDPNLPGGEAPTSAPAKTLSDYLADLGGDDSPERLYAARTLRGEARRALHAIAHAPPDSIASLNAQSVLVEVDARLPLACRSALLYANSAPLCAEMLADLEHVELIEEVRASRVHVTAKCALKRLDAATLRLEALLTAPLTAPQAAAAP